VLISGRAAEFARQAAIAITDRGVRSLKGLPGAERVFAVSVELREPARSSIRR
jgi:hypothetical protein